MMIQGQNIDKRNQQGKAELLRSLQQKGKFLVLPNAWDAAGARIFELVGFKAIATTSGGIAASSGYRDGQMISLDEMLDVVAHIARAVSVPVTADMEAGYGYSPEAMAETTKKTIAAGAVGMNLEDGTHDGRHPLLSVEHQIEKLRAVRETAKSEGVDIVLNARTDVYLHSNGDAEAMFDEAVERGKAYSQAGADSIFYIGLKDLSTIERLVKKVECPVNVLVTAGSPSIADLKRAGVARASLGSAFMRASLTRLKEDAQRLLEKWDCDFLNGGLLSHSDVNSMFVREIK